MELSSEGLLYNNNVTLFFANVANIQKRLVKMHAGIYTRIFKTLEYH